MVGARPDGFDDVDTEAFGGGDGFLLFFAHVVGSFDFAIAVEDDSDVAIAVQIGRGAADTPPATVLKMPYILGMQNPLQMALGQPTW